MDKVETHLIVSVAAAARAVAQLGVGVSEALERVRGSVEHGGGGALVVGQ